MVLIWCGKKTYHNGMNYQDIITIEPGKRGGKPCIRGMRIRVMDILAMLAQGVSEAEILQDSPDLEAEDIRASLQYTAQRTGSGCINVVQTRNMPNT